MGGTSGQHPPHKDGVIYISPGAQMRELEYHSATTPDFGGEEDKHGYKVMSAGEVVDLR
mgnify:CR=1 FL=1